MTVGNPWPIEPGFPAVRNKPILAMVGKQSLKLMLKPIWFPPDPYVVEESDCSGSC